MFAICVESSHFRGMGHLFRAIVFYRFLMEKGERAIIIVNNDQSAVGVLEREGVAYHAVESLESDADWETEFIQSRGITVWINDRLYTDAASAKRVAKTQALLVFIDDWGEGAAFAEIHFAAMTFDTRIILKGGKILRGLDYCILSPEVIKYRRHRRRLEKIAVTLGGSDTHGMTEKMMERLSTLGLTATVFLGPSHAGSDQLPDRYGDNFTFKKGVRSLTEELYHFDCAVTGGGVTAIEAAAAGLPALIVANEPHERFTALHLESLGCARYLGFRNEVPYKFDFPNDAEITAMSESGMAAVPPDGINNVYKEIKKAEKEWSRMIKSS